MEANRACMGLLRRRQCLVPTWRGWLALVLCLVVLAWFIVRNICLFLSPNDPITGGLLVVEGWSSDRAMEQAAAEFRQDHYDKIYVIGGPLTHGSHLSQYHTYAELGAATLLKLGLNSNSVVAVPAPLVPQDRTFTAAVALRNWLRAHGVAPTKIQLLSEGPHARRSRLLFEKAMGKEVAVGITSIECPQAEYDPRAWWRTSLGVRGVIDEAVAYGYARFLFRATKEEAVAEGGKP